MIEQDEVALYELHVHELLKIVREFLRQDHSVTTLNKTRYRTWVRDPQL